MIELSLDKHSNHSDVLTLGIRTNKKLWSRIFAMRAWFWARLLSDLRMHDTNRFFLTPEDRIIFKS
jgi:hypothetical protein